jgi:hypothetical protein
VIATEEIMRVLIVDPPEVMQRSLAATLTGGGHDVRFLVRKNGGPSVNVPNVQRRSLEAAGTETIAELTAGFDAAICFSARTSISQSETVSASEVIACADVPHVIHVTPLGLASHSYDGPRTVDDPPSSPNASSRTSVRIATTAVYGPGDQLVSRLLIMMRSLPVVPLLANGERRYQPVWHEDLTAALVRALDPTIAAGRSFRVAGPDVVTQQTLYGAIAELTGRRPARLPIPEFLTGAGLSAIDAVSGTSAATADARWAVDAEEILLESSENDLVGVFHVMPTSIREGLRRLIDEQPEQLPSEGVGTLEVKRFWSDIHGTHHDPASLLRLFRARFAEVMPIDVGVEQASSNSVLNAGATVTMHLPGRGHVQVRVEEADDDRVVLATLRGHPLAGFVRFRTMPAAQGVRFEVTAADRSANPLDWVGLTLGGARGQNANWRKVVENVARLAGGTADDVQSDTRDVTGDEADEVDAWIRDVINHRRALAGADELPAQLTARGRSTNAPGDRDRVVS